MKTHWWPLSEEEAQSIFGEGRESVLVEGGVLVEKRVTAACGASVQSKALYRTTHRVTCTRCRATIAFQAALTERLLVATPCPRCKDSISSPRQHCFFCGGGKALVRCSQCGGTGHTRDNASQICLACFGRGTEPL